MERIHNDVWNADVRYLLQHVGEKVEIYADMEEWSKKEIQSSLEGCLRDRKGNHKDYKVIVHGWASHTKFCIVELTSVFVDKKNKELLFLLKKGE